MQVRAKHYTPSGSKKVSPDIILQKRPPSLFNLNPQSNLIWRNTTRTSSLWCLRSTRSLSLSLPLATSSLISPLCSPSLIAALRSLHRVVLHLTSRCTALPSTKRFDLQAGDESPDQASAWPDAPVLCLSPIPVRIRRGEARAEVAHGVAYYGRGSCAFFPGAWICTIGTCCQHS